MPRRNRSRKIETCSDARVLAAYSPQRGLHRQVSTRTWPGPCNFACQHPRPLLYRASSTHHPHPAAHLRSGPLARGVIPQVEAGDCEGKERDRKDSGEGKGVRWEEGGGGRAGWCRRTWLHLFQRARWWVVTSRVGRHGNLLGFAKRGSAACCRSRRPGIPISYGISHAGETFECTKGGGQTLLPFFFASIPDALDSIKRFLS